MGASATLSCIISGLTSALPPIAWRDKANAAVNPTGIISTDYYDDDTDSLKSILVIDLADPNQATYNPIADYDFYCLVTAIEWDKNEVTPVTLSVAGFLD